MRSKETHRITAIPRSRPAAAGDFTDGLPRCKPPCRNAGRDRERFVRDYGLTEYDAAVLTQSKAMANLYSKPS